jgi:2-desacetyl-2-hydroxyethyl bacteriochlorophyllide A dehydrogenase
MPDPMHRDIVIDKIGPASALTVREITARPPGDDEVAIDVAYSGINFADIHMRLGMYPDAPKRPFVPGYEISGKVAQVGKNVRDLQPGDAVVAGTFFGGYASTVTIPAQQVLKLPAAYDLAAGAALPVACFTAQLAVVEMARVRRGDRVVIESATGGVGVIAVQMARHLGAEVTGLTTSPHKKSLITGLGATAYTVDEFRADPKLTGYDFILNATGGASIEWQRARLGLTGRMVCIGLQSAVKDGKRSLLRIAAAVLSMPKISVMKLFDATTGIFGLNALHVLQDPAWAARLTQSLATIDQIGVKPHIGKVFPAAEVAAAHAFLETKQATGKVLLQW